MSKVTLYNFENNELAKTVYFKKYALRDREGKILEKDFKETLERLINAVIEPDKGDKDFEEIKEGISILLKKGYFIPGGRVLYALGNNYAKGTLSNCYYLPIGGDTIEDIFMCCSEAARTFSYGGGVGLDISNLRPNGAIVSNSAHHSTGSISFMDLFSEVTRIIGQQGRRGALLISQHVSHPDIIDFINSKANTDRIQYANISVKISDAFMRAVEEKQLWEMTFKTSHEEVIKRLPAKEIWDNICENALKYAEPGILFWDTVKNESTSEFHPLLEIKGVNPCGEAVLSDYDSCNLGSIFLNRFVMEPFTDNARINYRSLKTAVKYAVKFLDNILSINHTKHPLKRQQEINILGRRVGLGISGLADMFAMLKIKYDSDEALEIAEKLFSTIRDNAYEASIQLSKEKGPFHLFNTDKFLNNGSKFVERLPEKIKKGIKEHGLRNVSVMSIAPTGSISIIGETSSGIEPIFALHTKRNTTTGSDKMESFDQYHPLLEKYFNLEEYNSKKKMKELKKKYNIREAHEINWEFRIKMQSIIQKYVDASISSTINLPEGTTVETIKDIYMTAWKEGLKGITVYVDNSRENIISVKDPLKSKRKLIEKDLIKTISDVFNKYHEELTEIDNEEKEDINDLAKDKNNYLICPQCKSRTLIKNSGCSQCTNPGCGYSACDIG